VHIFRYYEYIVISEDKFSSIRAGAVFV